MAEAMTKWYLFLSQLSAALSQPLQALAERVEIPNGTLTYWWI